MMPTSTLAALANPAQASARGSLKARSHAASAVIATRTRLFATVGDQINVGTRPALL